MHIGLSSLHLLSSHLEHIRDAKGVEDLLTAVKKPLVRRKTGLVGLQSLLEVPPGSQL